MEGANDEPKERPWSLTSNNELLSTVGLCRLDDGGGARCHLLTSIHFLCCSGLHHRTILKQHTHILSPHKSQHTQTPHPSQVHTTYSKPKSHTTYSKPKSTQLKSKQHTTQTQTTHSSSPHKRSWCVNMHRQGFSGALTLSTQVPATHS